MSLVCLWLGQTNRWRIYRPPIWQAKTPNPNHYRRPIVAIPHRPTPTPIINQVEAPPLRKNFSHFVFAQHWAETLCQIFDSCQRVPRIVSGSSWSIHGLWPSQESIRKEIPKYCKNDTATFPILWARLSTSEKLRLARFWPDLKGGNRFHLHEWNKHGTCSGMSFEEYVRKNLALNERFNIFRYLENAGITPSDTEYSIRSIRNAIVTATGGHDVILRCWKGRIEEVRICLDLRFQPRNCPPELYRTEGAAFLLQRLPELKLPDDCSGSPFALYPVRKR